MQIRFGLRWMYGSERSDEISADLFRLLQAIPAGGSLRAAARECGLSYRHAWGMLQRWEEFTGYPLVLLTRGKGALLTAFGEKLMREHQRVSREMEPRLARLSTELCAELSKVVDRKNANALRVCASHGLAVAMLRELAWTRFRLDLELTVLGSLDSLQLYKSGRCEVAGFHLPEGNTGKRFLPHLRRFLDPDTDVLIYAVRRRQGLMTAPDNPYNIRTLSDLVQKPVRFINRQKNSGTRITFDYLLQDAEIDQDAIQGYYNEEFTHLAVAALVASGAADCAFGIEEAARHFNLHFIPFNWETYWFTVAKEKLHTETLIDFLALLRGSEFHDRVTELSGYEAERAGTLVTPDRELNALLV